MNNVVSYSNGQEVNFSIQTHQTLMIKRGNYCFDTIYSSKDCMIFEILEKTVQTTKHIGNSTVSPFDVVFTNPSIRRFPDARGKLIFTDVQRVTNVRRIHVVAFVVVLAASIH